MSSGGSVPSSAPKDRSLVLSELLGYIHGYYEAALDRLPVEEMPLLIPRLLEAGVCFGRLDPVSNIVANTVCSLEPSPEANDGAQSDESESSKKGRKRKATAEEEEVRTRGARMRKRRTIAQRSLEGLITFLVCYFRYLPVSEALQYLALAKADLLAAVHLIERIRGIGGRLCPISSPTMEIALRCAAIAASQSDIFAARSLSLASRVDQIWRILTIDGRLSTEAISRLQKLLEEPVEQLAGSTKPVQAIEQLPRDALRRRHHRGLLRAGHCFGPADDPVTNIILNTIWFDTAFPPHVQFEVDMISTKSLMRVECRSLNGLLAFLNKLFPALSEHDAMIQGTEYDLHIICGVNSEVPEDGKHSYILNEEGYPYSHINFLARPKGSHLDDMAPNLFFLECSNDEKGLDKLPSLCTVLVSPSDSGRCFHCEFQGIKIVHPDFGTYRGRETDFEEMACGKRKLDNEELIGFGLMRMEFMGMVSDDSVYSDLATDSDFTECMNYLARREEKEERFLSGECQ
ncbi:hypothetical protein HU200_047750 [Digitaria exilis]|uniref:PIR2-like helical domain-containing protein n=1 Tax=Digitaria exilis TaxID=1010633 RepID=A0A835ATR0_9POAL|nr:hypothetical protein HU200_047750 [Digitaria exilis]